VIYTLINKAIDATITISNDDDEIILDGDLELLPFIEETLNEVFPYFGPDGYEPVLIDERPELLPVFLLRFMGQWEITPDPRDV
jgi:hypothetical protein